MAKKFNVNVSFVVTEKLEDGTEGEFHETNSSWANMEYEDVLLFEKVLLGAQEQLHKFGEAKAVEKRKVKEKK